MPNELQGKTIAILAADGGEKVELEQPRAALKQAGARVEALAPTVSMLARSRYPHRLHLYSSLGSMDSLTQAIAAARPDMIVPCDDLAARLVAKDAARVSGRPMTAGAGGPSSDPASLAGAFAEADRCLSALTALGRVGEGAGAAELGFVGLLLGTSGAAGDAEVARFIASAIGPVVDYDLRRGTALVRTLEAYFGVGGGLAKAAELLHVHVNTVTQRLERVGQLIGPDWQLPERALEVQLALRLHRLRAGPSGS